MKGKESSRLCISNREAAPEPNGTVKTAIEMHQGGAQRRKEIYLGLLSLTSLLFAWVLLRPVMSDRHEM
jgi:hypothetical protein